jgi:hypothetical protein
MSADNTTQLVLTLLGFALAAGALGWSPYGRSVWPPVCVVALAAAALLAAVADELSADRVEMTILVTVAGLLAVTGGGPVTTRVFAFVDRSDRSDRERKGGDQEAPQTIDQAGEVLRGGAWIGALERLAVFAGLAAGFPESVAVVLALKGVGRFSDLRGDGRTGGATTERFIIGTFTSVLWAAACAGMVALVRR